jgi:hypothetical protein
LAEITEFRREISALKEELTKAKDLNRRQMLYAPVNGQVQELEITTERNQQKDKSPDTSEERHGFCK